MAGTTHDRRPCVLLIDDDKDFREILRGWLAPRYKMIAFPDGEQLLDALDEVRPDVLLMDVRLPGLDGYRLCREVRASPRYAELPVVFITAAASMDDFLQSADAGGTDYVIKPVERAVLMAKLEKLASGHRSE